MGSGSVDVHILDTHVWVWVVNGGPERVRAPATRAIRAAAAASALAVSAISLWEVATLESKGRRAVAASEPGDARNAATTEGMVGPSTER